MILIRIRIMQNREGGGGVFMLLATLTEKSNAHKARRYDLLHTDGVQLIFAHPENTPQ